MIVGAVPLAPAISFGSLHGNAVMIAHDVRKSLQAERAGVAWSSLAGLARGGSLERVAHGVYRVRGAGAPAGA